MKSSLKVDFIDTNVGLQPVIRVRKSKNLDDARDGMLWTFFQRLGGESNWLKIEFFNQNEVEDFINIFPVEPSQLPDMILTAFKRMGDMERSQVLQLLMQAESNPRTLPMVKCMEPGCKTTMNLGSPAFCPDHEVQPESTVR